MNQQNDNNVEEDAKVSGEREYADDDETAVDDEEMGEVLRTKIDLSLLLECEH